MTFLFRDGTFAFDMESSNSVNVADGRPHDAWVYRSAGQATITLYVSHILQSSK